MPYFIPGGFLGVGWVLYVLLPILLPTFAGLWYGRSLSRISTRESLLIGMAVAAGVYFLGVGWARFAIGNGFWLLAYGAVPVFLVAGTVVPKIICTRIDRARSEHPQTDYARESVWRKDFWIAVLFSLVFIGFATTTVPFF